MPASAAGEDTDAVHRRFVKETAAAGIVKDGVSEPSRDNEIAYEVELFSFHIDNHSIVHIVVHRW